MCTCSCVYVCMCVCVSLRDFIYSSVRERYDTRSIFKLNLIGLNSDLSFSNTG